MTTVPSTFQPEGMVTVKAGSLFDEGSLMVAVVVVEGRAATDVGCGAADGEGEAVEAVVAAAVVELLQPAARDATRAHTSTERTRECMTPPREFIGCARVRRIISRQTGRVEEKFAVSRWPNVHGRVAFYRD